MTEKEPVIIDGVDVSGCEDYGYRGKAGYWCHNYDEPCTDYPNCCFKQLARKTRECERLQKTQFCFAYEKDCHKVCKQQNCIIKNGYKAEQKLELIKNICHRKTEDLYPRKNPLKEILQIIDRED